MTTFAMATHPIPGGYCDRQRLADAIANTDRAISLLDRLLKRDLSPVLQYGILAQIACTLVNIRSSLSEMDGIRKDTRKT